MPYFKFSKIAPPYKRMTKIEFLKKLFQTEDVQSTDCGQRYIVKGYFVWVDDLKGGRVSIKVKFFKHEAVAVQTAITMYHNLVYMQGSIVDAATKWDVYHPDTSGRFPAGLWAARLRCDKHW